MPFLVFLAVIGLQIFMVVHVLRNAKPCWWIGVIILVPIAGSFAYFLVEIAPSLRAAPKVVQLDDVRPTSHRTEDIHARSSHRRSARARASHAQPLRARAIPAVANWAEQIEEREVKARRVSDVIATGTINDKLAWAEECMKRALYGDAARLYESAREGYFVNAADILLGLARALLENGDFVAARRVLRELAAAHPNTFVQERGILDARALAAGGDLAGGVAELEHLLARQDSLEARRLEARYYYAEFLWKQGVKDLALAQLAELIRHGQFFNMTVEEEFWVLRADEVRSALIS